MIFVLCLVSAAVAAEIMCVQKAGDNGTACATTDPVTTKCHGPALNILTGLSDYAPGCGACPADTPTCADCDGNNKTACNAVAEDKTFMCYDYAYNNETKLFAQAVNATTCHRLMGGAIACNSPDTNATAKYESANKGCGPCAADAPKGACKECNKDGCNSAAALTAFLLPLVAFFYTLF